MRKGAGSAIAAADAASMERVMKCIIRARSENRCRVFLLKKKGVWGRVESLEHGGSKKRRLQIQFLCRGWKVPAHLHCL